MLVVAGPDLANLRNAKNLFDTLRAARPNDTKPRLIMNGVGVQKRPEIAISDFAKAVDCEPLAIIPYDAKLFGTASNNGQMIAEVEATNKIAETTAELARIVTGRAEAPRARKTFLDPLLTRLQRKKAARDALSLHRSCHVR